MSQNIRKSFIFCFIHFIGNTLFTHSKNLKHPKLKKLSYNTGLKFTYVKILNTGK